MTTRKDKRTYADRKDYLKVAVSNRRRALKLKAIEVMGGRCMICGYDKHQGVLEFHHVDAATKSFGISGGGFSRSWISMYEELKKCILVCANCRREVELGLHKKEAVIALHTKTAELLT